MGALPSKAQEDPAWDLSGWQLQRRTLLVAAAAPPNGQGEPRLWLATGLEGDWRPAGGPRRLRGVLAFAGGGYPLKPLGASLGVHVLRRQLMGASALLSSSGEAWLQWEPASGRPQGMVRLDGSVAAGRRSGAVSAWYASPAFEPWVTVPGRAAAGSALWDGLRDRGTSGVQAALRLAAGSGRQWELRAAWQETVSAAASEDHPRLGYTFQWVETRRARGTVLRTAVGARFRPATGPVVVPQAGFGIGLRPAGARGPALSLDVLADLGRPRTDPPHPPETDDFAGVWASAVLEVPLGPGRLWVSATFPTARHTAGPQGLGSTVWRGELVAHLEWDLAPGRLDVLAAYAPGSDRISAGLGWTF